MRSLIVGCSSTHGSDTVSPVYDPANTQYSWANILSQLLGYEPDNRAIPGNSNQAIFHLAAQELHRYDLLVVGWTSLARESWRTADRQYFFNPNWACCVQDITMPDVWVRERAGVTAVTDQECLLEMLHEHVEFLIRHRFDTDQLQHEAQNYRRSLQALCQVQGVRYIDANIVGTVFPDAPSINCSVHPTRDEHRAFAHDLWLRETRT